MLSSDPFGFWYIKRHLRSRQYTAWFCRNAKQSRHLWSFKHALHHTATQEEVCWRHPGLDNKLRYQWRKLRYLIVYMCRSYEVFMSWGIQKTRGCTSEGNGGVLALLSFKRDGGVALWPEATPERVCLWSRNLLFSAAVNLTQWVFRKFRLFF